MSDLDLGEAADYILSERPGLGVTLSERAREWTVDRADIGGTQ